jgi:hippurate hydrolase
MKDKWQGTLMFIAQPAEEEVTGAKAMLDDGLFTRFPKPDVGFALHDGEGAYGSIFYRVGVGSSNVDGLFIRFKGRGGHGARPQTTIDPVMMAARFVVDVQSVISREKDPTEFGVVSIGAIHAGTAGNIIPDEARVIGTIRSFKPQVREKMLAGIERTAKAVAAMADAPAPEINLGEGTKAVVNDAAVVGTAEKVLKAAFGNKFVTTLRTRPARIIQSSSAPACPRCSSISASTLPNASPPPVTAAGRRSPPTTRRNSRRCRSRPSPRASPR